MIQSIAQDAEYARKSQALLMNIMAARNIARILKTNLGPRGTLKMLVGGAGNIRLTKDGNVLLNDMQISHPTAALIARAAVAQDDITGDGTTSIVLLVGEMMSIAERYLNEGAKPASLVDGILMAKKEARQYLEYVVKRLNTPEKGLIPRIDRPILVQVARTALRTKLREKMADQLTEIVVDAVECVKRKGEKQIDLHMVERMHMEHRMAEDTRLIYGLVLDHGPRHPQMSRDMRNVYILTCNVNLEWEKSEDNTVTMFENMIDKQKKASNERRVTDEKVKAIIRLKEKVCGDDPTKSFFVVNQKGIDPTSNAMLAASGISAVRRAKKRNMERIPLACGGEAINSIRDMTPAILGWASHVYEVMLGEGKYTFIDVGGKKTKLGHEVKSCTILFNGPNQHTIAQIKDATRDGLRAVKNAMDCGMVVPGAGAMEMVISEHLRSKFVNSVEGRAKLGVELFAEALLVIPKTLSQNSGLDTQDSIIGLRNAVQKKKIPGLDIYTGKVIDPISSGIFDNLLVKTQVLEAATYTATQLLYVDEILKGGKRRKR